MIFGRPGATEIVLVLVVLLLLFGARRIPELARSLGQALHMFKRGLKDEIERDDDDTGEDETTRGEGPDGDR